MDKITSFPSGTLKMVKIHKCVLVFLTGLFSFFSPLFSCNRLRQMPGLENVSPSGESGKLQAIETRAGRDK